MMTRMMLRIIAYCYCLVLRVIAIATVWGLGIAYGYCLLPIASAIANKMV